MSVGSLRRNTNQRHSFIQEMNEKWAKKYQDEQAWLDSIDRMNIERTS